MEVFIGGLSRSIEGNVIASKPQTLEEAITITQRVGPVAYKLELLEELSSVYSTFHIFNLKKCLSDESLVIPMKELRLDDTLNFVEEPVEIMDREVKQLRQSRIPIVKGFGVFVCLGSWCGFNSNPNSVTVLGGEDSWFLESKKEWGGRGVKEKDANVMNLKVVKDDVVPSITVVSGNIQVENIGQVSTGPSLPTVVDLMMEKDTLSSLEDTIIPESFPPLSMPVTTVDNALGKSSYANITGKPSGNKVNVKLHGVPVTAFSEDGLSVVATKLGTPLMLDSYTSDMCMQSWGRSSYARVMIELRADVELKDNIVVVMPKITREGHYTCNVRVEYEWKPPRCSSCRVFGHIHEECLKNTGVGEKKTVKKHSQTSRGVPVGPKIGFKHQKEYRHVPKKTTASSIGNKKKGVEPTIEVSNSNPFDVLNSVDNDVKFGTNGGLLICNTPIGEKIDKIERQICKGKLRLLDNDENPLVPTGIVESDSEVEVVFDETANLRISTSGKDGSDKGYGTNSLLEQLRDSYPDNNDYDPYDDDMYENHDLSEHLQSICDDLDITVRDRKKK
ncbi:cytokinin dehydrogenase 3-like protein [Tanacetum coccineum]